MPEKKSHNVMLRNMYMELIEEYNKSVGTDFEEPAWEALQAIASKMLEIPSTCITG
jgi:hypothetical protein